LNTGLAACIVSFPLNTLLPRSLSTVNKKLHWIFSFGWKLSFVHLRLFKKSDSDFWRVKNTFLSICVLTLLAITVTLACSSCAEEVAGLITKHKQIKKPGNILFIV
jgi:hypothetical protein